MRADPEPNALEAAYRVLREAGEPLHVEEITRRILATGIWCTNGKTPSATVNARIAVDIKSHGDASRFVRTRPATYALRSK